MQAVLIMPVTFLEVQVSKVTLSVHDIKIEVGNFNPIDGDRFANLSDNLDQHSKMLLVVNRLACEQALGRMEGEKKEEGLYAHLKFYCDFQHLKLQKLLSPVNQITI